MTKIRTWLTTAVVVVAVALGVVSASDALGSTGADGARTAHPVVRL